MALFHEMVMLQEVLHFMAVRSGGLYVDATFGGGGCARAFLQQADCRVIGLDKDNDAIKAGHALQARYGERLLLRRGCFSFLREHLRFFGMGSVDGVVFDLGVSSHQLDCAARGFSFMRDGPLDMRFGGRDEPDALTAADVVNDFSERALAHIFYRFGEERRARWIAERIVRHRQKNTLSHTQQLARVVEQALAGERRSHHAATRVFLALRLFVNKELEVLQAGLEQAVDVLSPKGRLVVLSFHSLEDRIVKRFLRQKSGFVSRQNRHVGFLSAKTESCPAPLRLLAKRVRMASRDEVLRNPRSRSAKLRAAEKVERIAA